MLNLIKIYKKLFWSEFRFVEPLEKYEVEKKILYIIFKNFTVNFTRSCNQSVFAQVIIIEN